MRNACSATAPCVWQQSAAILRVAHGLGWPWRCNRYWMFGRSDTCLLPPRDHAARFLD
jgi:predicted DCC family thiol-disulfide oxidoreductase YuxK